MCNTTLQVATILKSENWGGFLVIARRENIERQLAMGVLHYATLKEVAAIAAEKWN